MELQFGRLLGEDPKLTLAKILARKADPDVSYLDVEKSFSKNKGKLDDYMMNMQIDKIMEGQSSVSPSRKYSLNQKPENMLSEGNLNLSRPTMNTEIKARRPHGKPNVIENHPDQLLGNMKGVKSNITTLSSQKVQSTLNGGQPILSRPVLNDVKARRPIGKSAITKTQSSPLPEAIEKGLISDISLRKPSAVQTDDTELEKNPKLKIQWNLLLKARKAPTEKISDTALLKKPEVMKISLNPDTESVSSDGSVHETGALQDNVKILGSTKTSDDKLEVNEEETLVGIQQNSLDQSSNIMMNAVSDVTERAPDNSCGCIPKSSITDDALNIGLQPPKQSGVVPQHTAPGTSINQNSTDDKDIYREAPLLGKPTRLDPPLKDVSPPNSKDTISLTDEGHNNGADVDHFVPADQEGDEANDWKRAEQLLHTGERDEVELVSCNGKGFMVSFGSLIGFLPYRNLGAKWKFLAFESWLRTKGLDPSMYRQNLSVLGNYDVQTSNLPLESNKNQDMDSKYEEPLPSTMKFDDLLEAYDQEKIKFLSSFIGQKIRVSVVVADINSRRLLFSGRPKEKEESVQKKRSLMAKLRVGDIVKCCIKKITYFGIFVEVEEVPALIHQSELSWDATLDLSSFYKIDQIIEAKVHQLDYALERISLSLREVTPDPLTEALESVVGDHTSIEGSSEAAQSDVEWPDVDSLMKELQQIDGVRSVSKGRFFLSPGLAPTFQVYMASMFENQYKLLARYENKVQEVLVQASLDKEQMKDAILTSTNRVV